LSAVKWVSVLLSCFAQSASTHQKETQIAPDTGGLQTAATTTPAASPEHLEQLQTCREGITDPQARPADRRRWAELLLTYRTPQASELTIELLRRSRSPDVQLAVCSVLADHAPGNPNELIADFVPPLMDLLGAESQELRATAARALAEFPGIDVPAKLGALAARANASLPQRLAAIDALTPNVHRREVVAQLIGVLDVSDPRITDRAVTALESATIESFGNDPTAWRAWWVNQSAMDHEAWLDQQLRIYRDRYRATADELIRFQEDSRREQTALTGRIRNFQREVYRTVAEDQRDAKLVEWLNGQLSVVRWGAVSIIKTRMADEGKRPEGAVLTALLGLLKDPAAETRREVLQIVQNLNDDAVVKAVLEHLLTEHDPPTRHAVFRALGRLDGAQAIPALIREIESPESFLDCVKEAAFSLGNLAAKSESKDPLTRAVGPLEKRYRAVDPADASMRAALLAAMAGIGDLAFADEFLEALESDDATMLQPAIRGIVRLKDVSKVRRLRALMAHLDPLVRREAIDAVAQLGREEADVESLLTRLNPAIEANDPAREAAWQGFRNMMGQRTLRERIEAADRLRDVPMYQIKYLEQLADASPPANGDDGDREKVLERLTSVLDGQKRFAEAAVRLRQLYDLRVSRSAGEALSTGLRLLRVALRNADGGIAALVKELVLLSPDEVTRTRIVDAITEYLDQKEPPPSNEQLRILLSDLRSVRHEDVGGGWSALIERLAARVDAANQGATQRSSESPG